MASGGSCFDAALGRVSNANITQDEFIAFWRILGEFSARKIACV
jgi:hypothetical protein